MPVSVRSFLIAFLSVVFWSAKTNAQLATYIGTAGTSVAVTGYPNETVTVLQYTGFGGNTPCTSGGRSGITVNTMWSTYNTAGPRLFIQIRPNPGYALNMTGFSANLRSSGTGPTCARFAYSLNSGGTWVDDGACHATNVGANCNVGVTTSWVTGALPTSVTNTVDGITIAIFPYAPGGSTGTFQVNRIDIAGSVVPSCTPPSAISGTAAVCSGQVTSLSNTTPGGTWSSSNSTVATVGAAGTVTGGTAGQAVITYANGCSPSATRTVTVNPLPVAGSVVGTPTVCVGATTSLSSSAPGGAWTSSNTAISTVSGVGAVSGVSAGVSIISYTVSNVCGAAIATASVTVNPLPFAGTISGTTIVCAASATQLSSNAPGGVWTSSNTGIAAVNSTGVVAGVSAGSTVISYSVTNVCGTAVATTTVTVSPLPGAGVLSGPHAVCIGLTATLSSTVSSGVWSSGTTTTASFIASGVLLGAAVGTSLISYSVTNSCGTDVATHTFTVNPLPLVFNVTGGGSYCQFASSTLHIGLSGSEPGVNYQLYNPPFSVGGPNAGTGAALDFGIFSSAGSYMVIATNAITGCTSNMAGSVAIAINPLPNIYVTSGGGADCIGMGVPISLNWSDVGFTYQLYNASTPVGATVPGVGGPLTLGPVFASGTYTILAVNMVTGCSAAMSGSAVAVVTPPLVPSVIITQSTGTVVCSGTFVTFTASSVNGGTMPFYEWKINGMTVATGTNLYTYAPSNGDVISAKLFSGAPCAAPNTAIDSVVMTVHTSQVPGVNVAVSRANRVCEGEHVTFTPTPSYGGSAPTYRWMKNGTIVGAGPTYSCIPANGDNIRAIITSNFPCLVVDTALSGITHMTVDPFILPSVSIVSDPGTMITAGQLVTLRAIPVNVTGSSIAYQWLRNGIPMAGGTTNMIVGWDFGYPNFDSITCIITVSGGVCLPVSVFNWVYIQAHPVAIENVAGGITDLSLVPNPNKGEFIVRGQLAGGDQQVTVDMVNMLGQQVFRNSFISPDGLINESVAVGSALPNGMYVLNICSGTAQHSFKVMIDR